MNEFSRVNIRTEENGWKDPAWSLRFPLRGALDTKVWCRGKMSLSDEDHCHKEIHCSTRMNQRPSLK